MTFGVLSNNDVVEMERKLEMKYVNSIAAAAIAFAAAVPAFAGTTQVFAGNGLSLTQAAAVKFNNDTRQDDRQTVAVVPGKGGNVSQLAAAAGIPADEATSMSLGQISSRRSTARRAATRSRP